MKRFRTTAVIRFHAGTELDLSAEQAQSRLHNLSPVGKTEPGKAGRYRIERYAEFKAGEEIGLEEKQPRSVADRLDPVSGGQKKAEG